MFHDTFIRVMDMELPFSELRKYYKYDIGLGKDMELITNIMLKHYKYYYYDSYNSLRNDIFERPLCKNCYETFINYLNKKISLYEFLELIEQFDLDRSSFITIVYEYASCIENKSKSEVSKLKEQGYFSRNILDFVLNTNDEKEIFKLLTVFGQYNSKGIAFGNEQLRYLISAIADFVIVKYRDTISVEKKDIIIKEIKEKINIVYKKYFDIENEEYLNIKRERQEKTINEKVIDSTNIVTDFMSKNISLKQYLEEHNMLKSEFNKHLNIIKNNKKELYKQYEEYINNNKAVRYAVLSKKCNTIIDKIKNGVVNEETNEKREFDILDYYAYTNLTPDEFIELIINRCDVSDLRKVRTFFAKNKYTKDETANIRKMKYSINSMEISDELKEKIVCYLNNINSPVNMRTFRMALKKYFNKEIVLDEKPKTKKINN